jgi:hypothetical protein
LVPAVVPVTLTEKLHEVPAARAAPDRVTVLPLPVMLPPPQVPVRPLGVDTTNPAGSGSVNATPLKADVVLVLKTWNPSVVDPFSGMLRVENTSGVTDTLRLLTSGCRFPKVFTSSGGATTRILA